MFLVTRLLRKLDTYRKIRAFGGKFHKFGYKSGFKESTISICGINKNNYKDFITDKDYYLGHPYNGSFSGIIDNKLYLPMMLHSYKKYIPDYYFLIDEYGLLPLDDFLYEHVDSRVEISEFFKVLADKHRLIMKHTSSSSGIGVYVISQKGNDFYLNNKNINKIDLGNFVLSLTNYIVTEYVIQHSYSANISPSSLNTIRFLCIWDYKKKSFFLARCYHRFGCNGNIVDNVGSGNGLCVFVDVDSGILTLDGNINYGNTGDVYARDIIHPDHGVRLSGMRIPRFKEIKDKVIEIANSQSYLKYMGFDVAITEFSFKIIEINSLSSLDAVQQRKGFLTDERIRKVLKK